MRKLPKTRVKKQTKKDKLRQWYLPEKFQWGHLRYKQPYEKGVYWYYFSLDIRKRDVEKYGVCISCNRKITVDTCDCGHYIAASACGLELLMDETNNNAECSRCNAWDETHLIGYRRGLDARYGPGTADALELRWKGSKKATKYSPQYYKEKIFASPSYQQAKALHEQKTQHNQ